MTGTKETTGKLTYELDWDFIKQMAVRMSLNKGKYEPYNWQKPIALQELKEALTRHFIEIMQGNYDDEQQLGHLLAISCNSMMLHYQLKHDQQENKII